MSGKAYKADNKPKDHGALMQQIIEFNQYKTCVEVGVAWGTTTKYLCEGAKKNSGHVYGFDMWNVHGLHKQFKRFSSKEEVEEYLHFYGLNNFSLEKVDTTTELFKNKIYSIGEIDFAFIDGCHSYQGVKNDFDIIYPNLSYRGTIAFHDTLIVDGCREFIIDIRTKYNDETFDIIDFPYGNGKQQSGLSLLVKRSYPFCGIPIREDCGSVSNIPDIYKKEKEWYNSEVRKYEKLS